MTEPRVAVLIDADNTSGSAASAVIAEASRHGRLVIRRVYGDWTTNSLQKWKVVLADNAMQPAQQFANTTGKNATDSALIIDAIDLLHADAAEVFCIVSSDADFTRLASRLRESAKVVVGIGRRKTPKAFVQACERFVFLENLVAPLKSDEPDEKPRGRKSSGNKRSAKELPPEPEVAPELEADDDGGVEVHPIGPLLAQAYDNAEGDDGFAHLGSIGNQLMRLDPSFDPRTYGYRQLRQLVAKQPGYTVAPMPGSDALIVRRAN